MQKAPGEGSFFWFLFLSVQKKGLAEGDGQPKYAEGKLRRVDTHPLHLPPGGQANPLRLDDRRPLPPLPCNVTKFCRA
jgi:hypothetical protein